ncbi:MAG: DNA-binding protein [Bacteroidales bacterium]|nr:DNA-binding protein [Bacteroidales bacterium]
MRKVKAHIEIASDGLYSVYIDDDSLNYGVIGEGKTISEAIDDFYAVYEALKQGFKEEGRIFEEVEFIYVKDVQSFLEYYSDIFSKSALERMTGINQKQLHHYATGLHKPRQAQIKKIEDALHNLGKELLAIHF